jgi:hypothetical protein
MPGWNVDLCQAVVGVLTNAPQSVRIEIFPSVLKAMDMIGESFKAEVADHDVLSVMSIERIEQLRSKASDAFSWQLVAARSDFDLADLSRQGFLVTNPDGCFSLTKKQKKETEASVRRTNIIGPAHLFELFDRACRRARGILFFENSIAYPRARSNASNH